MTAGRSWPMCGPCSRRVRRGRPMASEAAFAPTRPAELARFAAMAGLAGVVLLAASYFFTPPAGFFRAYLFAYMYVLAFPLGSLVLLMLQHLTGGGWGAVIRRPLEAAVRTLWIVALGFVPIALQAHVLYPWASGEYEPPYPKSMYLNVTWFTIRAAVYFAVWLILAFVFDRMSVAQERGASERLDRRFRLLAGPGLALYGLTI